MSEHRCVPLMTESVGGRVASRDVLIPRIGVVLLGFTLAGDVSLSLHVPGD